MGLLQGFIMKKERRTSLVGCPRLSNISSLTLQYAALYNRNGYRSQIDAYDVGE